MSIEPDEAARRHDALVARHLGAIHASKDLTELTHVVCQAAVQGLEFPHAFFVLFNAQGTNRVFSQAPDLISNDGMSRIFPNIHKVTSLRDLVSPLPIPDLSENDAVRPMEGVLRQAGIHSLLLIPIVKGQESLGFLGVTWSHKHQPRREDVALLEGLASNILGALENIPKAAGPELTNDRINALHRASLFITSQLDIEKVLAAIFTYAVELLNIRTCGVYEYDKDREELLLIAEHHHPERRGRRLRRGEGMAGQLIDEKLPYMIISDYREWKKRLPDTDYEAVLEVPLVQSGAVLGVLFVEDRVGREYPLSEVVLLQRLADLAAVALTNSKLLSKEKEAESHLTLLLDATTAMTQAQKPEEGLSVVAELMLKLLPVSFCRILLTDESSSALIPKGVAASDHMAGSIVWDRRPIRFEEWPGFHDLLEEEQYLLLHSSERRFQEAVSRFSSRLKLPSDTLSLLVIPLKAANTLVGIVEFGECRAHPTVFGADKIDAVLSSASQLAGQIARLRLQEIADHRRQLLQALNSTEPRVEVEIEKLRHEIVRLAAELVGWTAAAMYQAPRLTRDLECTFWHGSEREPPRMEIKYGHGLVGEVAASGESDLVTDFANSMKHEPSLTQYGFHTAIAVPIFLDEKLDSVLLVADNADGQLFPESDREVLERFASRAALALRTARLLTREDRAASTLVLLHKVIDDIQQKHDLQTVVHTVLTAVTAGYGFRLNRAALFLLNENRNALVGQMAIGQFTLAEAREAWKKDASLGLTTFQGYLTFRDEHGLPPITPVGTAVTGMMCPVGKNATGAFREIVHSAGEKLLPTDMLVELPDAYREKLHPNSPVVLVPLVARGRVIGLLVGDNEFTRAAITGEDRESLVTLANSVAVVIDNQQLFAKFRRLFEASNQLLLPDDPVVALRHIATDMLKTAEAKAVSVILFDDNERVINSASEGMQGLNPQAFVRSDGISIKVMRSGKPAVFPDTESQKNDLNPITFVEGAASALCLPFVVQGKPVGVVWIHYREHRHLSDIDVQGWQLYVTQAAIAYDNLLQLAQVREAKKAAKVVADLTVLENVRATLQSIADGTIKVLPCDAVVLYGFDPDTNQFDYPATVSGVKNPSSTRRFTKLPANSLIHQMLEKNTYYPVEDVESDKLFRNRRFAKEEGVKSCVAMPLMIRNLKVGVMFVNYHSPHKFSAEELENIEMFAHQAATAIRHAHLYEDNFKFTESFSGLVHELRHHLAPLRNECANLIKGVYDKLDSAERSKIFAAMDDELRAEMRHIDNLLEIGRFMHDGGPFEPTDESLTAILHAVVKSLDFYATEKSVKINVDVPGGDPLHVTVDKRLMNNVFINVIHNAVKYTGKDGVVTVTASRAIRYVQVEIQDNGIGMSPPDMERIFDKFFRGESAKKHQDRDGMGIGLNITKKAVERHGGSIRVKSKPNKGSTFTIRIPHSVSRAISSYSEST